eukprot:scaffold5260_cov15-Tisochrysis_lutea.AAC.1
MGAGGPAVVAASEVWASGAAVPGGASCVEGVGAAVGAFSSVVVGGAAVTVSGAEVGGAATALEGEVVCAASAGGREVRSGAEGCGAEEEGASWLPLVCCDPWPTAAADGSSPA